MPVDFFRLAASELSGRRLRGRYPGEALTPTPPPPPTELLAVFLRLFSSETQNAVKGKAVTPSPSGSRVATETSTRPSTRRTLSTPHRLTPANTPEQIGIYHPAEEKYQPWSPHHHPSGASYSTPPSPIPISAPLASAHALRTGERAAGRESRPEGHIHFGYGLVL